jgi:hypothetical protein
MPNLKVPAGFRMAGRFLRNVPFVGDAVTAVTELVAPPYPEPSWKQRIVNAITTGAGGAAASAVTGGLDFIPAVTPLVLGDTQVGRAAPALDPYLPLRDVGYKITTGRSDPRTAADYQKAVQELNKLKQGMLNSKGLTNVDWRSLGL